ncbi:MAG: hypothetical protein ACLTYW_04145 [Collinsella sp.]
MDSIDELRPRALPTWSWPPVLGCPALQAGRGAELDVLEFLEAAKKGEKLELGEDVVVIGAGNTAMDAPAWPSAWQV